MMSSGKNTFIMSLFFQFIQSLFFLTQSQHSRYSMRLLVLVLNIVIGASLTLHSTDMLAASRHKTHKSSHKGKKHRGKVIVRDPGNVWDRIRAGMRLQKPLPPQSFANLHRPAPMSNYESYNTKPTNTDQIDTQAIEQAELASKYTPLGMQHQLSTRNRLITPSAARIPLQNYTRYGRQRLNTSRTPLGETNETIAQSMQNKHGRLLQPSPDYLTPGARVHTRIRTQLAPPTASAFNRTPSITTQAIPNSNPALADNTPLQQQSRPSSQPLDMPAQNQNLELIDRQNAKEEEIWKRQATIYGRFKKQVNGYTQRPDYLQRVAERSRPYIYHIVEELSQHDIPMELALLPVVESAFQSTALSPMSAAGIWQFMPGTGRDFNLAQNDNYDARLDVTASTRAAARFLYGLKSHFHGDWLLALAAYNCGQGTVDNAINANRAAGLGTDYWSLNLPAETMDYVPRLLAVAHIFANPGAFGVRLTPIRNEPYFVKVRCDRKADTDFLSGKSVSTVAQMAGLTVEEFNRLNSGYIQAKLGGNGPFTFLMPGYNASKLRDGLDSIAKFLAQPGQAAKTGPANAAAVTATQPALPSAVTTLSPTMAIKPPPTVSSPFLTLDINGGQK
jgi:soluble lytic murein transglycosylase-like protein